MMPSKINHLTPLSPDNRFSLQLKQLEHQANEINQLSRKLEQALWQFKQTASAVNQSSYLFRETQGNDWFPHPICRYEAVKLPKITQNVEGRLCLTSKSLDLLSHEREAHRLAFMLRQRRRQLTINN